ncbi:MAG: hypothetical protein FJ189_09505 [Gammaproteobacteria bacterium]|nr:hypothetical protein [Gammaproteobacteria bacterium]
MNDTRGKAHSTPNPGIQPAAPFDLRIQFDAEQRVLAISLNDSPLDLAARPDPMVQSHGHHLAAEPTDAQRTPPATATGAAPDGATRTGRHVLFGLTRNSAVTLGVLLAVQYFVYRTLLAGRDGFLDRYGWWILYLDLSVVALVATLSYLRSYVYTQASHMVGMMIGMTIGMQVSTMIGGVLGATNGFFVGSIVGMSLGSLYGVVTAWKCGPMAVMHGLMAGVMGGTMGAMVVVMMLPDHVLVFMPVFTTVNLLILMWFTYLFYSECVDGGRCPLAQPVGLAGQLAVTLLTVGFLSALMVAGPKGPMVWKGQKRTLIGEEPSPNPFEVKDGAAPPGPKDPGEMTCGAGMSAPSDTR